MTTSFFLLHYTRTVVRFRTFRRGGFKKRLCLLHRCWRKRWPPGFGDPPVTEY